MVNYSQLKPSTYIIVKLFFVLAFSLVLTRSAEAATSTCECSNMNAESEAEGTCTKTETSKSCNMAWNSGSSSKAVSSVISGERQSFSAAGNEISEKLEEIVGRLTFFPIEDESTPMRRNSVTLFKLAPNAYSGSILNNYLLFVAAAFKKMNNNKWKEIAKNLHQSANLSSIIDALSGSNQRLESVRLGFAFVAAPGCLEVRADNISVVVKTQFSLVVGPFC